MRALLLALLIGVNGVADTCGYDGKDFWVQTSAGVMKHPAAANFGDAVYSCGTGLSVLYDGDEIVVYVAKTRRFEIRDLANGFRRAVAAVSEGLAGVFDGESVVVYDGRSGSFAEEKGLKAFVYAQASAGPGRVAFYDGDHFLVYDEAKGAFLKETAGKRRFYSRMEAGERLTLFYDGSTLFVYDQGRGEIQSTPVSTTYFSTVVMGKRDVIFYDSKKVIGFCGVARAFASEPAPFDPYSRGYTDKATGQLVIRVFYDDYRLIPGRCEITK